MPRVHPRLSAGLDPLVLRVAGLGVVHVVVVPEVQPSIVGRFPSKHLTSVASFNGAPFHNSRWSGVSFPGPAGSAGTKTKSGRWARSSAHLRP